MDRENVDSSNVESIGYDPVSETLEVEFKKTGVYQYYNVPESVYTNFMDAPSKGVFLNANIKNSYPYSRVG